MITHWPSPSQRFTVPHSWSGSSPPLMYPHAPGDPQENFFCGVHAMHLSRHAESQQTPSAQNPLAHCAPDVHPPPRGRAAPRLDTLVAGAALVTLVAGATLDALVADTASTTAVDDAFGTVPGRPGGKTEVLVDGATLLGSKCRERGRS